MAAPYQLQPAIRMRPEENGALLFHSQTAETLFLDREGLSVLEAFFQGKQLWSLKAWFFKNHLWAKGFLKKGEGNLNEFHQLMKAVETQKNPVGALSLPEALHISLTDACNQSCSGCFFSQQNPKASFEYMSFETYKDLILQAQKYKIFQVALGGGEPLMHPLVVDFVQYAREHQVLPNLTTNGYLLTQEKAMALKKAGLGQLQISLNGADEQTHNQTRPYFSAVTQAIAQAKKVGLRWGLNIMVTRQNLPHLDEVFGFATEHQAHVVSVIRPKPAQDEPDWLSTVALSKDENQTLHTLLFQWQKKAKFQLLTDSSFSFLNKGDMKAREAQGLSGCSAGQRILSVRSDGRFSPCAHVPMTDSAADIKSLWYESKHLAQFRDLPETVEGQCSTCALKSVCKGCRAIVLSLNGNFYGEEPTCPSHQPISS